MQEDSTKMKKYREAVLIIWRKNISSVIVVASIINNAYNLCKQYVQ